MEDEHTRRTPPSGVVGGPNALDAARDAYRCLVTGPDPLAIEGRLFPGMPDSRLRLDQACDRLLDRGCAQHTRDAVWAHLVLRARTGDPAWRVGAVGLALPALTNAAAQLSRQFDANSTVVAEEVAAELLRGFLEALERVDVSRRKIATRLRWAAYRAAYLFLVSEANAPKPVGGIAEVLGLSRTPGPATSGVPRRPYEHPDLVLAHAVGDGVITGAEAELIVATRLEHMPVQRWAENHRANTWAVYKRRRRAEQRLVAWLLDPAYLPDHHHAEAPDRSRTTSRRRVCAGNCRSQVSGRPMSKSGAAGGLKNWEDGTSGPDESTEGPRCA